MRAGARLAGVLLAALLTVPAAAAPARVCRVVPDAKGDAAYNPLSAAGDLPLIPGTPADDLLSADVASDGTHLTVLWRMGQVKVPDIAAPMGRSYIFFFDVRNRGSWFITARTYPTGTRYEYGDFAAQAGQDLTVSPRVLGEANGRLDTARGWVLADVPARAIAGGLRRGTFLVEPQAAVSRWVGQGAVPDKTVAGVPLPLSGFGTTFDTAAGDHYVVGQPSCIRPGL